MALAISNPDSRLSTSKSLKGKMKNIWNSFKESTVCHLCLIVTFMAILIIVNIIQAVMFILIWPFSRTLYRKINYYVTYIANSQGLWLADWWSGSTCIIYGDPEVVRKFLGKEHALIIFNHSYEVDWLMCWTLCDRSRILGNVRMYMKKMLQYVPLLGWSWKFQEMVFLERNWEQDKKSLGKHLSRFEKYPDPFWLWMLAEGTRFTEAKHAESMKVAREKGLPELKHHLLPRTKGFVASVQHLKRYVPAIYDLTIVIDPKRNIKPTILNMLKGKQIHCSLMLRRIPMEEVPDNEEESALWLHNLYQQKDKLFDNYLNTGQFVPRNDIEEFKKYRNIELPRRYYSLLNAIVWVSVIMSSLLWYLWNAKSYLVVFFIFAAYYGMMKFINLSKINKSSSYGQATLCNSSRKK